jgi:hypothetical protein
MSAAEEDHRYCEITEFVLDDLMEIIVFAELNANPDGCEHQRIAHAAALRLKTFVDPIGFETEH